MNKSSSTYAVRTHEPSLATPLFFWKSERSCICVLVLILSLSTICLLAFGTVPTVRYFIITIFGDQGVRCTTLCDKVYQWLATGWRFSPGPPVSTINKNGRHDIAEILLKVALNTIKQTNKQIYFPSHFLIILEFWDINKCKFSKKIIK